GLEHRPALRAVVLEDPAPGRIGRIGPLVFRRVEQRLVDLARVAVVDQQAALVVFARGAEDLVAAPALPFLGVEVDAQIFGDENLQRSSPSSLAQEDVARRVDLELPARIDAAGEEAFFEHRRAPRAGAGLLLLDAIER